MRSKFPNSSTPRSNRPFKSASRYHLFSVEILKVSPYIQYLMKYTLLTLLAAVALVLTGCNEKSTTASVEQPTFQCISAKITIAEKQVDSVVQWNTKTGEARLLNAASFADKATGQNGNLIGWVPLVDLQQAVQNLAQQIQAQQAARGTNETLAAPTSTPIKPKN